jgi:hypothetical protein
VVLTFITIKNFWLATPEPELQEPEPQEPEPQEFESEPQELEPEPQELVPEPQDRRRITIFALSRRSRSHITNFARRRSGSETLI